MILNIYFEIFPTNVAKARLKKTTALSALAFQQNQADFEV